MHEDPREKLTAIEATTKRPRTIGRVRFDMSNDTATAELSPESLDQDRGVMNIDANVHAKDPPGRVERKSLVQFQLEYQAGSKAMESLRELQHRREVLGLATARDKTSAALKQDTKWSPLEENVGRIFELQHLLAITETLSQEVRTKGHAKQEQLLRANLGERLASLTNDLQQKVGRMRDGVDFIRHLLQSQQEETIRIGLYLVREHLVDSLEPELVALVDDDQLPGLLRRVAFANLHVDRQRSLLSAQGRSKSLASSMLARERRRDARPVRHRWWRTGERATDE